MRPMLGRKVVERQQHITIFSQARGGFGVLGLIGRNEPVTCLVRIGFGLGHPDRMQHTLGVGLFAFGQFVQYVSCPMHPASLLTRLAKDFA